MHEKYEKIIAGTLGEGALSAMRDAEEEVTQGDWKGVFAANPEFEQSLNAPTFNKETLKTIQENTVLKVNSEEKTQIVPLKDFGGELFAVRTVFRKTEFNGYTDEPVDVYSKLLCVYDSKGNYCGSLSTEQRTVHGKTSEKYQQDLEALDEGIKQSTAKDRILEMLAKTAVANPEAIQKNPELIQANPEIRDVALAQSEALFQKQLSKVCARCYTLDVENLKDEGIKSAEKIELTQDEKSYMDYVHERTRDLAMSFEKVLGNEDTNRKDAHIGRE